MTEWRCSEMGMGDDVSQVSEHGMIALQQEERHTRSLHKGGPTLCRLAAPHR